MKRLLTILLLLISVAGFSQVNEYRVRGNMYLIADSLLVIGTDTLSGTTQIDGTDTIFVTLDYLEANFLQSEVDGSVTNEIQTLSIDSTGRVFTINLTDGGSVTFEDTNTQLSEATVDSYVSNNGYLTSEVDGDVSNELQTISKVGSTVTLSDGGGSFTDDDTQLSTEQVQDISGGMFSGNTETLIDATYQDTDGTIDLVVNNDLSLYDNSASGFITSSSLHDAATLTGTGDYLTLSGQQFTKSLIDTTATHINKTNWDAYINGLSGGEWSTDANGINYQSGNVGIGTASNSGIGLFISSGNSEGLQVWGGGTTYLTQAFSVANGDGNANLFDIRGDGSIYAYQLPNSTTSYQLYYDASTKEISYGSASAGSSLWTDNGTTLSPANSEDILLSNASPSIRFDDTGTTGYIEVENYNDNSLGFDFTENTGASSVVIEPEGIDVDGIQVGGSAYLTSVSTGTTNNNKLVTKGYVDDNAGGGAPTDVNYLVGTADAGLSNEIVVGTTPNGDLGGTWGNISVDNDSHSHTGSTISGLSVSDLTSVTGTASSSTYLRGDNTWATVSGTGTDDQTLTFSGGSLSIEDGNSVNLDARYYTENELGAITFTEAGARNIGTYDEFTYSNNTNVQDNLDDIDNELRLRRAVQSLSGTSVTMNVNSGYKGDITLSGNTTITVTNLPDGGEGSIEVQNGSTYTFNINGSTGYTTEQIMGTNSAITSNGHTTVVYWRTGSTLYYGFIYEN